MTLGERIKQYRLKAGMSQEKVAELVGISRQAVTKWETNQSMPNTDNLFRLAEIFNTGVDKLLNGDHDNATTSAQALPHLSLLLENEKNKRRRLRKRNILFFLMFASCYLCIYLVGRFIWCDLALNSFVGWLIFTIPTGPNSYLYGWLLSSGCFWIAMAISTLPALWGKHLFSITTLGAFIAGLLSGMAFGPNPNPKPFAMTHYGWLIWGGVFSASIVAGIVMELLFKQKTATKSNG